MSTQTDPYYLPSPSYWPILGSIGLFISLFGFASALPGTSDGVMGSLTLMYIGLTIVAFVLIGWFRQIITESEAGNYNAQVDASFRMGMVWFIVSEVIFFAVFFAALFYVRQLSVPWLAGEGNHAMTNALLWKGYAGDWPSNGPAEVGGKFEPMAVYGIPVWNTITLLSASLSVILARLGLQKGHRGQFIAGLLISVILGTVFIGLQTYEYIHAYRDMALKLTSGIYGTSFYMLTGFHVLHVIIGVILLLVVLVRSIKGHFTAHHHFAVDAAAWYWHFVVAVWLGLFIFVYWLV